MCASAQTCASVGELLGLTSDENNEGQSPAQAMLMRKLQHYFYWKASLGKIQMSVRNAHKLKAGATTVYTNLGGVKQNPRGGSGGTAESAAVKRKAEWNRGGRGAPAGKRRRVRGGGSVGVQDERTFKGPPGADPAKLEEEATSLAEA